MVELQCPKLQLIIKSYRSHCHSVHLPRRSKCDAKWYGDCFDLAGWDDFKVDPCYEEALVASWCGCRPDEISDLADNLVVVLDIFCSIDPGWLGAFPLTVVHFVAASSGESPWSFILGHRRLRDGW